MHQCAVPIRRLTSYTYFLFQAFGSILEHLDFAHNEISYLPLEFCQSLTNLKTFDLSGNKFAQFDVSPLHHVSELKIEHSPYLESLEFTQNHLTQFKTFSAKNCSKLSQFCPWIIWSSPLLHTLDLGKFWFTYLKHTGKSLSEALYFAEQGESMTTNIVLNVKNNFCTQHVLPMFWPGNFQVLNL